MGLIFFIVWLILNAHFAWDIAFLEIVVSGAVLSAAVYYFLIKLTDWSFKFDLFFIKNIHLFIAYGVVLLWNVITSNFHVLVMILKPHESPEPYIVSIDVPIKNEILRAILANSITLTPGTITISCTSEHFIVHCLRKEYIDGIEDSALVHILEKMEAKLK